MVSVIWLVMVSWGSTTVAEKVAGVAGSFVRAAGEVAS